MLEPVPGGYAFYKIIDTEGGFAPNREMITVSKYCPAAALLANKITAALNHTGVF